MNPITSSSPQPLLLPLSESPKPISDQSLPPVSSEVSAMQVLEPGTTQLPEVEVKAPASTSTTTTTVAVLPAAGPSDMKMKTSVDALKVEEALDTTRRSGSWFGSWGRRKGKDAVVQNVMGMEIEGGNGASQGGLVGMKAGQERNSGGSGMYDDKGEPSGAQEVIDLTGESGCALLTRGAQWINRMYLPADSPAWRSRSIRCNKCSDLSVGSSNHASVDG